jgi:hypothetical protein
MVIAGSTDGGQTFQINDPGANLKSGIVKMTKEQLMNPSVADWQKDCGNNATCMTKYGTSGNISGAFKFGLYIHPK